MCGGKQNSPGSNNPIPVKVVGLAFNVVNSIFGLGCKIVLAPLRGGIGQKIPFSHRRHLVLLPERLENVMGEIAFAKATIKEGKGLPDTHPDVKLVRDVGSQIVAAVKRAAQADGGYTAHLARYKWEFTVIESKQVNAFVVPGGKVVVYTGLLDTISRDADKLAIVIGHEASHVLARHSAEGMALRILVGGISWAVALGIQTILRNAERQRKKEAMMRAMKHRQQQPLGGYSTKAAIDEQQLDRKATMSNEELARRCQSAAGNLSHLVLDLPNSRRNETEADLIGLKLAGLAGFNISKAPQVWADMERKTGGGGVPAILSSHPGNKNRAALLAQELKAMDDHMFSDKAYNTIFTKMSFLSL